LPLLFDFVEICVDSVENFAKMDLGRVEHHRGGCRSIALVGPMKKSSFGKTHLGLVPKDTTGWYIKLREQITLQLQACPVRKL
jgi:hypothetical protein